MGSTTIKGITVALGGDTTQLQKSFKDLDGKSRYLQKELTLVNKELKFDPKNSTLLAAKQEVLSEKVETTRQKLKLLNDMQAEVEKQAKAGTLGADKYRQYQTEVESTKNILANLEKQLKTTGDEFAEVQRKSGAVTFKNAEDKAAHLKGVIKDMADSAVENMEKVSKTAETVGTGLEKAGSVLNKGSAAAAAVLAGSVASFKDLDEGYDVIVKKTGATDDKFESLKKTADELFSGSTFDMTDIGNAIGEVNTRFGYTDEKLKAVTESYLQFAKINDADVSDSVSKTARIMAAWNLSADELPDLLGMITAKGQETGIAVGSLMDKVLDNNATFKEMGLSLEESITLMAQFERNGVNDSTALTAMKTAVKNATKEGKSLSEALKDSVSDIKNATTDTEALQKATELFGTKGAAEMANAIREDRINFDDLSGSMTDYRDTVKKTYDATLDPLEESKQVLNNLKLAGADLAATALKEGKPLIEDVIDGVKGVTNWLKKLTPEEKKTLTEAIKIVAVAGPVVTITGKLVKGIGGMVGVIPKLVKGIKGVTSATKTAETAQIGLNAAQSASPVGALITLLGLLAAAITTYYMTTDEATMRAAFLTEEEDKLYRRIDENIEKWNELKATREEASKEIEGQYGYYEGLSDRLKEITDKSGEIKSGYEEEARTIVNVLNDAFGKEYEITGNVIQNYQQMQEEIDKLIQLQKAQAQQEAYSESYKEAISNRTQAWQDVQDAEKSITEKDNKLRELREKYNRITTGKWVQTTTGRQWVRDTQKEQEKAGVLADIKYEEGQRENAVEEFKKYQRTYLESLNLIQNYEGVVSAIASKDSDAISEALTRMTNDFVTADNATQEMLENQHEKIGDALAAVSKAYDEKAPGVTKSMLDNYRYLFSASQQEMQRFREKTQEAVESTTKAVEDESPNMEKAVEESKRKAEQSMDGINLHGRVEHTIKQGTQAIEDETPNLEKAGEDASDAIEKSFDDIDLEKQGGNIILGLLKGFWNNSIFEKIGKAVGNVSQSIYNAFTSWWDMHSPAKKSGPLGQNIVLGVPKGMLSEKKAVEQAGEEINEALYSSLQADSRRIAEIRRSFNQNLADLGIYNAGNINLQNAFSSLSALKNSRLSDVVTRTINNSTTTTNKPVINVNVSGVTINNDSDIDALTDRIANQLGEKMIQDGRRWG